MVPLADAVDRRPQIRKGNTKYYRSRDAGSIPPCVQLHRRLLLLTVGDTEERVVGGRRRQNDEGKSIDCLFRL